MGIILALGAAAAYGLSDFIGGVASRRGSAWPVALLSGVGGLGGALALMLGYDGSPTAADLAWGALSGVGSGVGTVFLYRGFAAGRMSVVAPVSAVGAAVLPVAVALALGERPEVLVWLGVVLALPGIWLVARVPDAGATAGTDGTDGTAGLLDGALAGIGFGLLFVAMGQVPDTAGYGPLVSAQAAALALVALGAVLVREPLLPTARVQWWGLAAGLLASAAVLLFLLSSQTGLLTVAAVLTSLYPAFTIVLAAVFLREHVYGAQGAGLALCGTAVALIAAG